MYLPKFHIFCMMDDNYSSTHQRVLRRVISILSDVVSSFKFRNFTIFLPWTLMYALRLQIYMCRDMFLAQLYKTWLS